MQGTDLAINQQHEQSERNAGKIAAQMKVNELAEIALREPVVFVAGAGVSMPAPSCLPSGRKLLELVLRVCAPRTATPGELDVLGDMPPELYYQSLLEVAGPSVRSIWAALEHKDWGARPQGAFAPNLGHFILVYLAHRHGVPLLTLNYDRRFEAAAEVLGIPILIKAPFSSEWRREATSYGPLHLWKMRGSAQTGVELDTALHDLTRLDMETKQYIEALITRHRVCLAGYSGRDMDIFPTLVEGAAGKSMYWLVPRVKKGSLVDHYSDEFSVVESGIVDFALEVLGRVRDAEYEAKLRLAKRQFQSEARVNDSLKLLPQQRVASRCFLTELLTPNIDDGDSRRLLIHGLSLAMIGEHLPREDKSRCVRGAVWYLDSLISSSPSSPHSIRALIVKAYCLSELSKYRQSQFCAEEARRAARAQHETALEAVAVSSAASARYMRQFFSPGVMDRRNALRMKGWVEVSRHMLDYWTLRKLSRSGSVDRNSALAVRARWALIGHRIRLWAILQKLALHLTQQTPLARRAASWLADGWTRIESECREAGYAVGLANCRRYAERVSAAGTSRVSSAKLFVLVVARLEQVLIRLREAYRQMRSGELSMAQAEFRECIEQAGKIGSCALVLRGLVGLRRAGGTLNTQELLKAECSIRGIEADALEEIRGRLLDWLKDSPHAS